MTDYRARADYWAAKYGVDPNVFEHLVQQESGWNPAAVSPTGAVGLTQALPSTARDPGFGVAPLADIHNPDDQLRFGAEYLAAMQGRYGGNTNKALAAYNAGPGVADKWNGTDMAALPNETQGYINNITGSTTPISYGPNVPAMPNPSEPAGLTVAKKKYEPDRMDALYSHIQQSGMGKAFGMQPDAFRNGSALRTGVGVFLSGLGGMA